MEKGTGTNGCFLAIILVLITTFIFSSSKGDGEIITVYYQSCSSAEDLRTAPHLCRDNLSFGKQSYKVFAEKQFVVYESTLGARRLNGCFVFDSKNWRCNGGHWIAPVSPEFESHYILMSKGRFSDSSDKSIGKDGEESPLPAWEQISRFEYVMKSIGQKIRNIVLPHKRKPVIGSEALEDVPNDIKALLRKYGQ